MTLNQKHCPGLLFMKFKFKTRLSVFLSLWLQADLKERYSVNELLADLAGCKATRVLLFVDQSYSGVLSKRLRGSQKHLNVVLIQSQTRQTHNHQNQRLNPSWEENNWSYISSATCLLDHLEKVFYHIYECFFFCYTFLKTNLIIFFSSSTNYVFRALGCLVL